ncbi:TRAP transporter large permease subunit [Chloroflexota bacterium]
MIYKALYNVSRLINSIGLFLLAALMFLMTADVVMRYIFNRPIEGAHEIVELMMAMIVGLGLAYAGLHKRHIAIDLIVNRFEPRARAVINTITSLITLSLLGLIAWRAIVYAEIARLSGRVTVSLHIPIWPFIYLFALGMVVFCLVIIYNISEHLPRVVRGSQRWVASMLLVVIVLVVALFAAPIFSEGWLWKMSPFNTGIAGIVLLVVLLFSGMSIGITMVLIGFLGIVYLSSIGAGLTNISMQPFGTVASYSFSVIPLFVLMGDFCAHSGIIRELFNAAYKWLGRLPGGLAIATIGASAAFSAVTGSMLAIVATMSSVALPEMRRYKYNLALASASIVAAAGLGIMIPPSTVLVIYGLLAEVSIGKLLLAGFVPGITQAIIYSVTIYLICRRNPMMGPRGERFSLAEKFASLKGAWVIMTLFILVIGGLYLGVFTPMEAAGVGAFGAFLFTVLTRRLNWKSFTDSLVGAGKISAMIFLLIIGALLFSRFLSLSRLPFELADVIASLELNRYIILTVIIGVYLILGCFIDIYIVIIITIPVLVPLIETLGFSPIWFGVISVLVVQMGAMTPPFATNLFVITRMVEDVSLSSICRGIIPFLVASLVLLVLLIAFPQIALFLPNLM